MGAREPASHPLAPPLSLHPSSSLSGLCAAAGAPVVAIKGPFPDTKPLLKTLQQAFNMHVHVRILESMGCNVAGHTTAHTITFTFDRAEVRGRCSCVQGWCVSVSVVCVGVGVGVGGGGGGAQRVG